MTIEEQLQQLADLGDPHLTDLVVRANDMKNALMQNEITKGEYLDMLNDLIHEKNIHETVSDLELKEHINTALNALVNVASLV
jgi:hypothetical protein